MSFFKKLSDGLKKTKDNMVRGFEDAFNTYTKVDDRFLEELEDILIMSDVGMETSMKISDELREAVRTKKIQDVNEVRQEVKAVVAKILDKGEEAHKLSSDYPVVVMVIGVNGVGKTTSIAKIANGLKNDGKKVLLVAGDTFRAAAADQLEIWGDRIGVNVIRHK
ncbi:MAG: signal recognition particle receptor subunit alpha, partial [Firmicutes bacterium]|nr:signal recognition particle receptor subunit alpha [Bacillota bacterium]